ncbi:MAG: hypothetical protein ACK5KT_05320 [Dysgonomonas sp.]
MKFLDYIRGQRKGKEAHRIEKDSMQDPFLYEAIEGFDSIDDNHIEGINKIQSRLRAKSESVKKSYSRVWQTAAAIIVITFGLGGYFLNDTYKSNLYAQETVESRIIDLYVPDIYYTENIVPIAQQNAKVAREVYKPEIKKFKIDESIDTKISKEELDALSDKKQDSTEKVVIEIYAPETIKK